MTTLGTCIPSPQADFFLMRSYLPQLSVSGVLGTPTIVDNHIYWINQHGSGQDYHILLMPDFLPWSAGRFQITEIVEQCWYEVPPSPTKNPVTFGLAYIGNATPDGPSLLWSPWLVITTPIYIPLETTSQPYWWLGSEE